MKALLWGGVIALSLGLSACSKPKEQDTLLFATTADYPPFEYIADGQLTGFDVELAQLIAKELGKKAEFENMEFRSILASLDSGLIDAGIATITATPERQQKFDFSQPYYNETIVALSQNGELNKSQLAGKKIVCQLGSTMEIWLKKEIPNAEIIPMDNNNQAIEALKAGHVDVVLMDEFQGKAYCEKNSQLSYAVVAQSQQGYGIVFKKGSELKEEVNKALQALEAKGEIKKLQEKWFGV